MQNNKYRCSSKVLFRNGTLFLIIFPLVLTACVWGLGLLRSYLVYSLATIYLLDLILFAWLFLSAWDKTLIVSENSVAFRGRLFNKQYNVGDLQDITLLANQKGQEFLRIRTSTKQYYVDEQYQPWDPLLNDLEILARKWEIKSNLTD